MRRVARPKCRTLPKPAYRFVSSPTGLKATKPTRQPTPTTFPSLQRITFLDPHLADESPLLRSSPADA